MAAKKVDSRLRAIEDSADPNAVVVGLDSGNAGSGRAAGALAPLRDGKQPDEQFPSSGYQDKDPRDVLMEAKLSSQVEPGVTPFGVLQAKDSDFEWLRKKRETEAYANFSSWFAEFFDHASPAQKQLAQELFPRFYREREEQLDRSIALQARIAKLKLLGVRNKDDLMLQYAAEAGLIDSDPLEYILHPEKALKQGKKSSRRRQYGRGLFNPRRLHFGDTGPYIARENADSIFGDGRTSARRDAPFVSAVDTGSGKDIMDYSFPEEFEFAKQYL